ncbi:helix-turn-helix transcriptional regulator [Tengunoibacter tsumagoiensis]|uniref:HTH cro/C1-type domain-containing protein n=1 Tax=Tengunoibacter tsumagoiensis TaxID=2014871 RepID=A0A401ZZ01_9CHLR|nr:helix-turn-helix domain-containing protein [Tengunoibacter tsumagoiensis]GCE12098.1 hypothetical protein KTT_19570 [Tengunoibacter tsumagoiensis]
MEDTISMGRRIQQKRIEMNLTQEQMAELLDAATTTISRWESGVVVPSPQYRKRLCEIFRIEHKELFGNELMLSVSNRDEQTIPPAAAFSSPQACRGVPQWPRPSYTPSAQPLVELEISIPTSVVSAREFLQSIQKSVKVNGKQAQSIQDIQINDGNGNGNITIAARLYAPEQLLPPRSDQPEQPPRPYLIKKTQGE